MTFALKFKVLQPLAPVVTTRPTLTSAKPLVKWAGGKSKLLPELGTFVPKTFGAYHEPFVGGGAPFFAWQPRHATLCDKNGRLIRTYKAIRDTPERIIAQLKTYPYDKTFFYRLRAHGIDAPSDAECAARFIYLNRTCYNGLYRENKSGHFNASFGKHKNPLICDEVNLRACSTALQGVDVRHESFEYVLNRARFGDFVYFDPPYLPLSTSSSFTDYTADGFGFADHVRLRDVALELKHRGVHVLISNSAAPAITELYASAFEIHVVKPARSINSKGTGQGKIDELVIR